MKRAGLVVIRLSHHGGVTVTVLLMLRRFGTMSLWAMLSNPSYFRGIDMTYQELHLRMDAWRMTATKLAHATGDNRAKLERLNAIAYKRYCSAQQAYLFHLYC